MTSSNQLKHVVYIKGINNTSIVEKTREYGEVIEWEARHQCIGDVWETITKKDVKERVPIMCMLCGKDIVTFEEVKPNCR